MFMPYYNIPLPHREGQGGSLLLHYRLHRPFLGRTPALYGDGKADDNCHNEEGHGEEPPVHRCAVGERLYPPII